MQQPRKSSKDKQTLFQRQVQNIYQILTNKRRYLPQPFRQQDLQPQLVIKLKIPQKQYISKKRILTLGNLINSPSFQMGQAYSRAQSDIINAMALNQQNDDPNNLKIRLQTALERIDPTTKKALLSDRFQQKQQIDLECIHSYSSKLDLFSLQVNLLVYTLQHVCGFRVKMFILYDEDVKQRHLYMFLSLSTANLMRVANDYRIKKEIDYAYIDFFLNDPSSSDQRPLKLNSQFKSKGDFWKQQKRVNRYFNSTSAFKGDFIQQQESLDILEVSRFQNFNEQYQKLFLEIKEEKQLVTNNERDYLFEFNRGKVNPGCEQLYLKLKKQRKLYEQTKKLSTTHKYKIYEAPQLFQEFSLPNNNMKGATFFNKLRAVLLYKPSIISKQNKMSLFLSMEKANLCYILLKKNLQVNYLNKIGGDIFTLSNDFQKFGQQGQIRGGLDGKCLTQSWPIHSLGCDIKTIISYVGTLAAFQIMFKNYLLKYFFILTCIYISIYVIESNFDKRVWFFTSIVQFLVYTVSFNIFIFIWGKAQERYISNYTDGVSTKIFLQSFRGPYRRNLVTDQPSQFFQNKGVVPLILNLVVIALLGALLVAVGAVFHGIMKFILLIYEPLQNLVFFDYISLAHIIAYSLFFLIQQILRKIIAQRVITLMVLLKSPPTDDDQRLLKDRLTFYYVLGIELIPSVFFLIIQPFLKTQCYSNSCEQAMLFYIYSRSIIAFLVSLTRLVILFILNYFSVKLLKILKTSSQPASNFPQKLTALFQKAMAESQKPQHDEQKLTDLATLTAFAIFFMLLPILPLFLLLLVIIKYIVIRMQILYQKRRPLPTSQKILPFLEQLTYIFYIGVLVNSWIFFYSLQFIQLYGEWYINIFIPNITEDNLFTLKFVTACILGIIMISIGGLTTGIAQAVTSLSIQDRQKRKYQQYLDRNGIMKVSLMQVDQRVPLQSLFRVYNPDKLMYQQISQEIYKQNLIGSQQLASQKYLVGDF